MLDILTPLARQWRLVVLCPIVLALVAGTVSFLVPLVYTATATFTPISTSGSGLAGFASLAGITGLAGQLGLPTSPGASTSPDYFADVLHSREILSSTLLTSFAEQRTEGAGSSRLLIDIIRVKGKTEPERLSKGVRKLDKNIRTSVDKQTGIVTLEVRQGWPELAAAVANRLIDELNEFNLQRRQSQSRAQRQFTEQRLKQAEEELREAERTQLRFLETNRRYTESPVLTAEAARLERAVQLKQEVFLTLSKAFEEARIAEVRDTPVLTVIDRAVPPDRRSSPRRVLYVLVALVIGGFVGAATALVRDLAQRLRHNGRADYREFRTAWAQARREITSVFRQR